MLVFYLLFSAVHFFQTNFPETGQNLSSVNPLLAGGINVVRYFLHWPGKSNDLMF